MNPWLLSLPFIGALTGWVTNYLAIKMLFHPREPKRILGLKIQGVFPKRQTALAASLGRIVAEELLSFQDIKAKMADPKNLEGAYAKLEEKVDNFLNVKLKEKMPMAATIITGGLREKVKVTMLEEFQGAFPELLGGYLDKLEKEVDVERIVREKVEAFSSDRLEAILFSFMNKEFKFIELAGAILGFLIGLIQLGMLWLTA